MNISEGLIDNDLDLIMCNGKVSDYIILFCYDSENWQVFQGYDKKTGKVIFDDKKTNEIPIFYNMPKNIPMEICIKLMEQYPYVSFIVNDLNEEIEKLK